MDATWPGRQISVRKAVEVFAHSLAVVHNERIPQSALKRLAPGFADAVEKYEDLLAGMQLLSFDQMIEAACNELAPNGRLRKMLQGNLGASAIYCW
jgi:hypothetical protein